VFEESPYKELTDSLDTGNSQAALDELHRSGKKPGEILKYYETRTTRPLTGNKGREEEFKKSLTPEQLEWYNNEYRKRERDLVQIEILLKISPPPKKLKPLAGPKKYTVYDTKWSELPNQ
jgi:hypothetical protein